MFEVVKEAGLLPHEVANVLDVSRVTVSLWLNGHTGPHKLLTRRVRHLLDAVRNAVESGELPVPSDLNRRERSSYVKRVLAEHFRAATEGKNAD